MIKFNEKPLVSGVIVSGFNTVKVGGLWYTLHLNGLGYYGLRVDGRTVAGVQKRNRRT